MKYWNEIEGSKFFNMVFSRNISIGEVKLFALNMDNNLSTLTLAFDIRETPDTPPKKWETIGYNACRIGLTCGEIRDLTTSNIPTQKNLHLSIQSIGDRYMISAVSSTSNITFTTSSLRLREPSVYLTDLRF
ncbi:Imm50 family immunity protein [Pseudomonas sp. Irchel s3f10]|uniref:Imm50 family immunity protein n=1 Tax=Pseudomonas sp. Irchel s3f10 TaxID=2009137 RepID=UPI000BA4D3D5